MQTKFPTLHYVTITALTTVILLVFLLETDRKVILFLDKFQTSLVWGFLVATLTAIYCIGIDLNQPFIGTYTVPAEQLLEDETEWMEFIRVQYDNNIADGYGSYEDMSSTTQNTIGGGSGGINNLPYTAATTKPATATSPSTSMVATSIDSGEGGTTMEGSSSSSPKSTSQYAEEISVGEGVDSAAAANTMSLYEHYMKNRQRGST